MRVDKEALHRMLAEQRPELNLVLADRLTTELGAELYMNLRFKKFSDFSPEGIAQQVPEMRKLLELRGGLMSLLGLLQNDPGFVQRVSGVLADEGQRRAVLQELGLLYEPPSPNNAAAQGTAEALPPVIDDLLHKAKHTPEQDGFSTLQKGLQHFFTELLSPNRWGVRIDRATADAMIAEIDDRLSAQINEALHHPEFQRLESAWRALKYLIDRVDFRENIRVEVLHCPKDDLVHDFEDALDICKSGLYKLVKADARGGLRADPIGLIVADYEFGPGHPDATLLQKVATVSALAHAPFVAAASPRMFGMESWEGLPNLEDLEALFEGPQHARWHVFRESEDARYVGLCVPRFLLRTPYGEASVPAGHFRVEEDVAGHHDRYLWGNSAFLFAARVAASFARCGLPSEVVGLQSGGYVEGLPQHPYVAMGVRCTKIPTEVDVSLRMELALAEQGMIGLVFHEASGGAAFLSARSCHKPKYVRHEPVDAQQDVNRRAACRLPDTLLTSRVAQYIETMRFERRKDGGSCDAFARDLTAWLDTLFEAGAPSEATRASRPLRAAAIVDISSDGPSGWWRCEVELTPHETYEGRPFSLFVRC